MLYYTNRNAGIPSLSSAAAASQSSTTSSSLLTKASSHALPGNPSDGISHLTWSNEPNASYLSCGSWDGTARVWQIAEGFGGSINSSPKCMYTLNAPVLTSCFSPDNTKLFAGGCDKMVKMFDLNAQNSQGQQVAQHDQPVCKASWCYALNTLVTASWDGNLRMWDGKSAAPVWQFSTGAKIYAMDIKGEYMAAADSQRHIYVWKVSNLSNCHKMLSQLKMMTRAICVFTEVDPQPNTGVIVGSIEGRCAIMHVDDKKLDFSFRCHRQDNNVYALNAIDYYPRYKAFVTCGGDGTLCVWHKDQRQKLRAFSSMGSSVVDCSFNPSGNNLLAYAVSYDWHKGLEQSEIQQSPNAAYVHALKEVDLKPRPKTNTTTRR